MSKGRVKLPPLVLDGEVKVLHDMTLRELHVCLTRALRVAGGDSVEESGRSVFSILEKPSWWPVELPFDAKFTQAIPPEERSTYYRHLLTACYSHYKQEDTLHLFDSRPGEPPRWRLVKDDDGYNIVSTHTDRPIWTYSNNYQILPLITLAAKQAEQYRAAINEQLKRSKNDVRDLVIRTRRQKANPPSHNQTDLFDGFEPGMDMYADDAIGASDFGHQVTPLTRPWLLADGSPRRFSIMNWAHRFSFSEFYNDQSWENEALGPDFTCCQCNQEFKLRTALLEHQMQSHAHNDVEKKSAASQRLSQKSDDIFYGLGLTPRHVVDLYKKSMQEHEIKTSASPKRWKSQFIGCQLPLTSELGRSLFGPSQVASGDLFSNDFLSYERFCITDTKKNDPSSETSIEEVNKAGDINGTSNNGNNVNQRPPATKPRSKFFPIVYRPPRLISHSHTYKFTMAERRLFARMQENGGLDKDARRLLKQCIPLSITVDKLTRSELENYGIAGSDLETSSVASGESSKSQKKTGPKRFEGTNIVTRSSGPSPSVTARALTMVRRKYWSNYQYAHLRKRIGAVTANQETIVRRRRGRPRKIRIRRSNRGLVPRRRFSVEENGQEYRKDGQTLDLMSLPVSPSKMAIAAERNKFGKRLFQRSLIGGRRPQREHRLPMRYRSPDRSDEKKRKTQKSVTPSSSVTTSPSKQPIRLSPVKPQTDPFSEPSPAASKRYFDPDEEVAALVAKIFKQEKVQICPTSATAYTVRKPVSNQPSMVLPVQPNREYPKPSRPEHHAPPPYSMLTNEHWYTNLCGYADDSITSVPRCIMGRFTVPRALSPETNEHMRETVNEIVEMVCYDKGEYSFPETSGIAFNEEDAKQSENIPEVREVKQEIKEEIIDDEEISRCISESTIVSDICEVLSSGEDDDDELSYGRRSPTPEEFCSDYWGDDLPPAKRLKMTFMEMCAKPQKLWTRPPILGIRRPTILGGRTSISNGVNGHGKTSGSSSPLPTSANYQQEESVEKDIQISNSQQGFETSTDSTLTEQSRPTLSQTRAQPQQMNINGIAESSGSDRPMIIPAVKENKQSTAEAKCTTVQMKPIIIFSGSSATSIPAVVTTAVPSSVISGLANRTIRMPVGCKLVIPMKTTTTATPNTSAKFNMPVLKTTTKPTVVPSVQTTPSTAAAMTRPIRPRLVRVGNLPVPGRRAPPKPAAQMHLYASQRLVPSFVRFRSVASTPVSGPVTAPQTTSTQPPTFTSFKCTICGVELSFVTSKAWQNIQYHMTVAHRTVSYRLRKIAKKRSTGIVVEAVAT